MGSKDLLYAAGNSLTAIPFIGILRAFASVDPASTAFGESDSLAVFADGSLDNA